MCQGIGIFIAVADTSWLKCKTWQVLDEFLGPMISQGIASHKAIRLFFFRNIVKNWLENDIMSFQTASIFQWKIWMMDPRNFFFQKSYRVTISSADEPRERNLFGDLLLTRHTPVFVCPSSSIPTYGTYWVIHHSSFRAIDAAMRAHQVR